MERGRQQEQGTFIFKKGAYYSNSTEKEEKVYICYSRERTFSLSSRRYRMISPFLFSKGICQRAVQRPPSRYAGRREDGACFRL